MHLKMLSAEVVCCLHYITDKLKLEANSVDPEQTAPESTLFAIETSETFQQMRKADDFL